MWNEIDLLINDDTGSGRLSVGSGRECGTALYQVDTLVKITSSDKVSELQSSYAEAYFRLFVKQICSVCFLLASRVLPVVCLDSV